MILVKDDTTEEVQVTIGLRDGQNTQITSGLNPGDLVLVSNNLPVQSANDGRPGGGGPFSGND